MPRLPIPDSDDGIWGDVLNDFLSTIHNPDGTLKSSAVADATTTSKGKVQLAGDLSGTADAPSVIKLNGLSLPSSSPVANQVLTASSASTTTWTTPASGVVLDGAAGNIQPLGTQAAGGIGKAADSGHVHTMPRLDQVAAPTASVSLNSQKATNVANPTLAQDAATKNYVDTQITTNATPDATTLLKGKVQLAGDLAGTAALPTVPGLATKANTSTTITAGSGLTGGGDLSANRTISASFGVIAGTVAQGNDARITGAEQTTNKGAASGYAPLDGSSKVPIANLPTGTTSSTVAIGNDARITGAIQSSTATTKGDLLAATAASTITRVGVGSDAQVLTADSTQATGVRWATPASSLPPSGAASNDLSGTYPGPTVAKVNGVAVSGTPASGQVLTATSSSAATWGGVTVNQIQSFSSTGTLAVQAGVHRLYNDTGATWTIKGVRSSVGTAPTGSSIIVDVKLSGTTIFTTQANRPAIAASAFTSGKVTNMDVTAVPDGSYLTVDIAQVGSSVAGADLCVQVEIA